MATYVRELDQTEKSFQKQTAIFVGKRRILGRKTLKSTRYVKPIGMGFGTPRAAKEGVYVDKKCPFTSNVSIRGRILKGVVVSAKMKRSLIVRRDYLHYCKKYKRYEKRHSNIPAHVSPAFPFVKEGDVVTIGQCRPLSKTIRFNVIEHEPSELVGKNVKKIFRMF